MEAAPTPGHKRRRHSAADSECNLQEATSAAGEPAREAPSPSRPPPRVLLVHPSALLSCNDAVARVIPAVLAEILPGSDVPGFADRDALRAFSRTPILQHILRDLGARPLSRGESARLRQVYWRVFCDVGAPLVGLAPGAGAFLDAVRRRGRVAVAVLAHNTAEAAKVLADAGVSHLVDAVLPALPAEAYASGDPDPEAFRSHWDRVVIPWLTAHCCGKGVEGTDRTPEPNAAMTVANGSSSNSSGTAVTTEPPAPEHALLVSSVLADLSAAKAGGDIQTCWFRRIDAADPLVTRDAPGLCDLVIGGLDELHAQLFGGLDGRDDGGRLLVDYMDGRRS
ncbi:hypothetical protein VTH06DRAFT_162 [Thermothelomyces fergusii]